MLRQAAPFFDEGKPAILDASYLRRQVREGARAFAERAGGRFVAVERLANEPLVRERLHRRRSVIWNPSDGRWEAYLAQIEKSVGAAIRAGG